METLLKTGANPMRIITKREADRLQTDSLFTPGGTLSKSRFDLGKYKGRPSDYIGREVPTLPGVMAVFPARLKDRDGPYVVLYSYSR